MLRALRSKRGSSGDTPADVMVRCIGLGAAHAAEALSTSHSLGGIILAGFGGALDPSLAVGDVVIDGERCDCASAIAAVSSAQPAFRIVHGLIADAASMLSTPAAKSDLLRQTGALAVDMESAAIRKIAAELVVPLLIVRAISDSSEDALPPQCAGFITARGNTNIPRVLLGVCRRPTLARELARMRRNASVAGLALGTAVRAIIDTGWPNVADASMPAAK